MSQEVISPELVAKIHRESDKFGLEALKNLSDSYEGFFKECHPDLAEDEELVKFYVSDFLSCFGMNAVGSSFRLLQKLDGAGYVDSEGNHATPIEAGLEVLDAFYYKTITEFKPAASEVKQ